MTILIPIILFGAAAFIAGYYALEIYRSENCRVFTPQELMQDEFITPH